MRINCDNIESFGENADEKNLVLIYFQNQTDMLGRQKKEMERRIEQYDCAESALLLKTFAGIRQTIMQRELAMDKEQHKIMQNKKKAIKTVGMPPSGLF